MNFIDYYYKTQFIGDFSQFYWWNEDFAWAEKTQRLKGLVIEIKIFIGKETFYQDFEVVIPEEKTEYMLKEKGEDHQDYQEKA